MNQDLSFGETELHKVVENVLTLLKPLLDESHAVVRVPRPLPRVHCDFVRIGEVFNNLISNALKYSREPGPRIEIGFQDGPVPVYYVKDNGIGIAVSDYEAVFNIFKRLHKPGEYGGGSGSGLAITKRIIERHGGRIWIESETGKGATFFFTLAPEKAALTYD